MTIFDKVVFPQPLSPTNQAFTAVDREGHIVDGQHLMLGRPAEEAALSGGKGFG
jgi:hypothetical protein